MILKILPLAKCVPATVRPSSSTTRSNFYTAWRYCNFQLLWYNTTADHISPVLASSISSLKRSEINWLYFKRMIINSMLCRSNNVAPLERCSLPPQTYLSHSHALSTKLLLHPICFILTRASSLSSRAAMTFIRLRTCVPLVESLASSD